MRDTKNDGWRYVQGCTLAVAVGLIAIGVFVSFAGGSPAASGCFCAASAVWCLLWLSEKGDQSSTTR